MPHRHNLETARRAKREIAERISTVPGVTGVGIGWNRARDDYAVHVFVRDDAAKGRIPSAAGEIEVCVEVTGEIGAR